MILLSRRFIYLLTAFLMLSPLSCGKQEPHLTVSLGGAPAELDFWVEMIDRFEQETGIPVSFQRQPSDTNQRRQQLVISLRAKQPDPDVFLMDVAWLSQFAASQWLEPLDGLMRQSGLSPDTFFTPIINQADTFQGSIVALPVYIDGGLLYYRTDLLEKYGYDTPPETWGELVSVSQHIQQQEREHNPQFYGFVWQGAQYEGLICTFTEISASHNGSISIKDRKISFDTPQNREAVSLMRDFIQKYKISPEFTYTELKEDEVRLMFQNGNALFERNWPYAWSLHQQEGSTVKGKVGIAPLPHSPECESASTLGGWHIGISRYSDVKDEAWRFVEYIVSYEMQKKAALSLGWNPGRTDIYYDKDVLQAVPYFARLRNIFNNAITRLQVPYYTQLSAVMQRAVHAVISGSMEPGKALSDAEKELQAIVNRYENHEK